MISLKNEWLSTAFPLKTKPAAIMGVNVTMNIWSLAYKFSLLGLILFSLYFGTPVFGVISFRSFVVDVLGCSIPFDYTEPCIFYGYDIAPRFTWYKIPFASLVITPFAYLIAFFEIIITWAFFIVLCRFMSKRG